MLPFISLSKRDVSYIWLSLLLMTITNKIVYRCSAFQMGPQKEHSKGLFCKRLLTDLETDHQSPACYVGQETGTSLATRVTMLQPTVDL